MKILGKTWENHGKRGVSVLKRSRNGASRSGKCKLRLHELQELIIPGSPGWFRLETTCRGAVVGGHGRLWAMYHHPLLGHMASRSIVIAA